MESALLGETTLHLFIFRDITAIGQCIPGLLMQTTLYTALFAISDLASGTRMLWNYNVPKGSNTHKNSHMQMNCLEKSCVNNPAQSYIPMVTDLHQSYLNLYNIGGKFQTLLFLSASYKELPVSPSQKEQLLSYRFPCSPTLEKEQAYSKLNKSRN